jgi:hypothetical protein
MGLIAPMTDNPRHELRHKQVRGFLNGPGVAAWFLTAHQMWMAKESVRSRDIALSPSADHPFVAKG